MINVLLAHVCLTEFVVLLLHAIRQILVHIVTACGRRNPLHMQNNEKICWQKIKRSSRLAKCGNNKCKRGWKMGNSLFEKNHAQMKMFYEETKIYVQILLSCMYFKD